MTVLGIAVGRGRLRAVMRRGRRIVWAGECSWEALGDLADGLRELAADLPRAPTRVRLVLDRDLIQIRSTNGGPLPPSVGGAHGFRRSETPLVTAVTRGRRPPCIVVAEEPLVDALLAATHDVGWPVPHVGTGSEMAGRALRSRHPMLLPSGEAWEILRVRRGRLEASRLVRTKPQHLDAPPPLPVALTHLGDHALDFVTAYGATMASPRVVLTTPSTHARRLRGQQRRAVVAGLAAMLSLVAVAGAYRMRMTREQQQLAAERASLEDLVAQARGYQDELARAQGMLRVIADARAAPQQLMRLEALTTALPESAFLTTLEVRPGGEVALAGYAPNAAQALVDVAKVDGLVAPRLTAPVSREQVAGRTRERFSAVAQWKRP